MSTQATSGSLPQVMAARPARVSSPPARPMWGWIGTLYFAIGTSATVVMTVSAILFKRLGLSNHDVAFYLGALTLPWVLKPLWCPFIEIFKTKRFFVVATELLTALALAGIALGLASQHRVLLCIVLLAFMALCSAVHDIAADGLYVCLLTKDEQVHYIGWLGVAFHSARLTAQGLVVALAGTLEGRVGVLAAWQVSFALFAVMTAGLALHHARRLPREESEQRPASVREAAAASWTVVSSFFRKETLGSAVALVILYRLVEGQLVRIAPLFLLEPLSQGGLELSTVELGTCYGTFGVCAFVVGALVGGRVTAGIGSRRALLLLCAAFHLPAFVYLLLAGFRPESLAMVGLAILVEQFLYGLGSTGLKLLTMRSVADGPYKTAHFAFITSLSALTPALTSMASGTLQEWLGYTGFFGWTLIAALPAMTAAWIYTRRLPRRRAAQTAGTTP